MMHVNVAESKCRLFKNIKRFLKGGFSISQHQRALCQEKCNLRWNLGVLVSISLNYGGFK